MCCNKLATKENLFRRRCASSQACPICSGALESIEHLLFHCAWTRAVWFGCDLGLHTGQGFISSARTWTQSIIEHSMNLNVRKALISKAATVGWFIWKERNEWVFSHKSVNPLYVISQASSMWQELSLAPPQGVPSSFIPPGTGSSSWTPPPRGQLKVNYDASLSPDGRKSSVAVVLRD